MNLWQINFDDFDDGYFTARKGSDPLRMQMHELDRAWIFSEIHSFQPHGSMSSRTFLDIGCADGQFIRGFNLARAWGIEPNVKQQNIARINGLQIVDNIAQVPNLDTVILHGVLHHLPDYTETITQIVTAFETSNSTNQKLLFLIANPNSDCLVYKKFGRLPALEYGNDFASVYKVHGGQGLLLELNAKGFVGYLKYPYWRTPYANYFRDFAHFLKSFYTGEYLPYPFPRNMFNLVAKFST